MNKILVLTLATLAASSVLAQSKVMTPPLQDTQIQLQISNDTNVVARVNPMINPNAKWVTPPTDLQPHQSETVTASIPGGGLQLPVLVLSYARDYNQHGPGYMSVTSKNNFLTVHYDSNYKVDSVYYHHPVELATVHIKTLPQ